MAVPDQVRKNWEAIQQKYDYPVNAIGVKIDSKDERTLSVWKEEGIDSFVKK